MNDTNDTPTDDNMTDEQRRVQALLASGHINQDEADILFAALAEGEAEELKTLSPTAAAPSSAARAQRNEQTDETPDADRDGANTSEQRSRQHETQGSVSSLRPPIPLPPAPAEVQQPQSPEPPRAPDTAPDPMIWVKLSGFCGDLTVTSDPHLSSPIVDGNALLEHTEAGYLIRTPPESKGGNWLQRLHKAAGDVRVRLPAEMGLELGVAAGDGEIRGVKVLKGTFTGGDLDVLEAETVDLTVTAGDVTLKLRPRAGEGRVKAISGDVDVIFLAGTSATVSGSATCGDLDLPPGFTRNGGFANHKFEGTLGAGEARLELRLTAGDVSIRAEDS